MANKKITPYDIKGFKVSHIVITVDIKLVINLARTLLRLSTFTHSLVASKLTRTN